MSGFAAIFERYRRPLTPESLVGLARDLAAVEGGMVGQAEAATATTLGAASKGFARVEVSPPRRPTERQDRRGGTALEVSQLAEFSGFAPAGTAEQILLAGLRRLGRGVWSRIDGVFGCVLFDPDQHVLYLARDPVGERTLYFAEEGERVFVADRLQTLLRRGGSRSSLDVTQVARFFGLEPPRAGRTFFQGVREVEPGCVVEISEEGVRHYRFWTPQADALECGGSDEEYATRFRTLLQEETRSLVNRPGELGIMLSGGIDSTSVAVLAAAPAGQRDSESERPAACSWVFDELGSCDERSWIDETLAELDLDVIRVSGDDCWPLVGLDLFSTVPDSPYENPFRALKHKLYAAARDRGRRLLLNGGPADLFYRGYSLYLRDLVRAGRVGTAGQCLVRQVRETGWRSAAGSIGRILRPTGRRQAARPAPSWLVGEARDGWTGELDSVAEPDRGPRDVVPYLAPRKPRTGGRESLRGSERRAHR